MSSSTIAAAVVMILSLTAEPVYAQKPGAEKIVSGLAGAGSEVTVTYDSHGTAKVATRIEVKPKK